jgi:hypothetical protein
MDLKKVSKALAGAGAAILVALLGKLGVMLPAEFSSALEVVLDLIIAALIGYLAVYLVPKNKGV